MKEKITEIIIEQAKEVNEDIESKIPIEMKEKAPLFGKEGVLDSIALVTLIVGVEQAIEDELDEILTIADEKAMSQKHSPFRTIDTLSDYIEKLIKKEI